MIVDRDDGTIRYNTCNGIDISKDTCEDNGRMLSVADKIIICKDFVILVEEAKDIDINKVNQLIEAMENLKSGKCNNVRIKAMIGNRAIKAGILHALERVSPIVRHMNLKKSKILVANCEIDLKMKVWKILNMIESQ